MKHQSIMNTERYQKYLAQVKLCESKGWDLFILGSKLCWSCGEKAWDRITLDKASTEYITGCPMCNRSFCD